MRRRREWCVRLGLVLLCAAAAIAWLSIRPPEAAAQVATPALPMIPPNGAWGEVIMANSKWVVVQNHLGQQFPIRWDAVGQCLVRWPSDVSNLTNDSVIEAFGVGAGTNALRTDHLDVFEGTDQVLAVPTFRSLLPNNRMIVATDPTLNRFGMSPWDYVGQTMTYGWAYAGNPDTLGMGMRMHVVGNVLNVTPLGIRVAVPGNNSVGILPGPSGLIQVTQVTMGTWSFFEKGDWVFLTPSTVRPDSLVVQQLVLYKKVPRNRFGP